MFILSGAPLWRKINVTWATSGWGHASWLHIFSPGREMMRIKKETQIEPIDLSRKNKNKINMRIYEVNSEFGTNILTNTQIPQICSLLFVGSITSLKIQPPFGGCKDLFIKPTSPPLVQRRKKTPETSTVLLKAPKTNEPRKKPSYFPLYWLVNRDPYNGLLQSLYNWVV